MSGRIFVTSDPHFCHAKEFLYGPRGFDSVEEMNRQLVINWNQTVAPDDVVWVLGDLMLNDNARGIELIKQLNGELHIILGNHDTDVRELLYAECYNVAEVVLAARFRYNGYNFYLSHYPTICTCGDIDKPLRNKVINLCGHSHTSNKWADWSKGAIYHCELDAHNNKPVALDDIIKDLEEVERERNDTF